ncbi:MAG TPA: 30S ribosomal protein S6 [Solirubrobacteraceae bacterium]|nr:30S ribosomal protein S6 [Solirubrobacteraceae bacterium]
MTVAAPTYDLVLLLDTEAEDNARAKIVADARAAIEAQGELLRHDEWGTRTLAYPIKRKTVAEYHMMQFHASSPELLRQLDRSLRLADEAIRHRIIKLKSGVPAPPDMRASASAPATGAASASERPAAPAPPAAEAPTDAPAPDPAAASADPAAAPAEPAAAPAEPAE